MNGSLDAARKQLATTITPQFCHMLVDGLEKTPSREVASAFAHAVRTANWRVFSSVVIPAMYPRLQKDSDFFRRLCGLVDGSESPEFEYVLLDALDTAARTAPRGRADAFFETLRSTAVNERLAPSTRRLAVRRLARNAKDPRTTSVFAHLAKRCSPELLDGLGHVVYTCKRHLDRVPPEVTRALIAFAGAQPGEALRYAAVLKGLSVLRGSRAVSALTTVARSARTADERRRIITIAGERLPAAVVGELLKGIGEAGDRASLGLETFILRHPETLAAAFDLSRPDGFIWWLKYSDAIRAAHLWDKYLEKLRPSASEIGSVAARLTAAGQAQAELLRSIAEAGLAGLLRAGTQPDLEPDPPLAKGFATDFHRADAMYRLLESSQGSLSVLSDHWHAAMFNEFEGFPDGTGKLSGIQQFGTYPWTSHVSWFATDLQSYFGPNQDLADGMGKLYSDFLDRFDIGEDVPFHGTRSRLNIDGTERDILMHTPVALIDTDPGWCGLEMLDWNGSCWDATCGDVDDIRCDGVPELAYEREGIRVSGGVDSWTHDRWRLGMAGNEHAESHNQFHQGNHGGTEYSQGDLCPRIQANDCYNDSYFVVPPSALPVVYGLEVQPERNSDYALTGGHWVVLYVTENTYTYPRSSLAFVRLKVRKVGEPTFRIAVLYDCVDGLYGGAWVLKLIPMQKTMFMTWRGDVSPGPAYPPGKADFEFRAQAIDLGGNVSAEVRTVVELTIP